ncbi:MAG TPA: hypothetical protein VL101_18540, partial [Nordella sp.]|nr:hypothetical protein [Nordella sp.]
ASGQAAGQPVGWATAEKPGERINFGSGSGRHGLRSLTILEPSFGFLLRICSPSGTEHARITDHLIFHICSRDLAQHLVAVVTFGTSAAGAVNLFQGAFRAAHLPFVPKWD